MKIKNNCYNENYKCPNLINARGSFCTKFQNLIKDMIACDYAKNKQVTFKGKKVFQERNK